MAVRMNTRLVRAMACTRSHEVTGHDEGNLVKQLQYAPHSTTAAHSTRQLHTQPIVAASTMETRSRTKGAPLKKPGAYNTDLYYQEKDEGFGDVGVDQEPDAGQLDDRGDPTFEATGADMEQANKVQAQEDESMPVDETNVQEEMADLKARGDTGEQQLDEAGEPVPVVQEGEDEVEANAAGYTVAE